MVQSETTLNFVIKNLEGSTTTPVWERSIYPPPKNNLTMFHHFQNNISDDEKIEG